MLNLQFMFTRVQFCLGHKNSHMHASTRAKEALNMFKIRLHRTGTTDIILYVRKMLKTEAYGLNAHSF